MNIENQLALVDKQLSSEITRLEKRLVDIEQWRNGVMAQERLTPEQEQAEAIAMGEALASNDQEQGMSERELWLMRHAHRTGSLDEGFENWLDSNPYNNHCTVAMELAYNAPPATPDDLHTIAYMDGKAYARDEIEQLKADLASMNQAMKHLLDAGKRRNKELEQAYLRVEELYRRYTFHTTASSRIKEWFDSEGKAIRGGEDE